MGRRGAVPAAAARSAIRDTDDGFETAELTRASLLYDASARTLSMLLSFQRRMIDLLG